MPHINSPAEPEQKLVFDAELGAWWHTQLSPEGLRQLSEGMEGVMRRSILPLLPAEKLGEHKTKAKVHTGTLPWLPDDPAVAFRGTSGSTIVNPHRATDALHTVQHLALTRNRSSPTSQKSILRLHLNSIAD